MGVRNCDGPGSPKAVEPSSNSVPSAVRVGVNLGLSPISVRNPLEELGFQTVRCVPYVASVICSKCVP